MKVTTKWLKERGACDEGIIMFEEIHGKSAELKDVINFGIKSKDNTKLQYYCNWLIVKKMNHGQQIKYAIYAAEQVLNIFEKKYPDDKRPRLAIEAAKKYLKLKTKDAAADAAEYAATAALKIKILKYGLKIIGG